MDTDQIDLVQQYKYLGILLDEHLKLESCDDLFAKSGGRPLSALIAKYNVNKNFNHFCLYSLVQNLHFPCYGSEACGYYKLKKRDQIQYRAICASF